MSHIIDTWGTTGFDVGWGERGALTLILVVSAAASATSALGAATLTYPRNGQTVTFGKKLSFDCRWTLPAGEVDPEVWVGDHARFDPTNDFGPFQSWCGGQVTVATSCGVGGKGVFPIAGVHYAVVATDNADFSNAAPYVSPEVRFTVPARVGLRCAPTAGCEWPRTYNAWYPFGGASYGYPHSSFDLWAWTNGTKLTFAFTLRHGRHVLKRFHRTVTGSVLFDTQEPGHLELGVFHEPGIAAGTRLACTVTASSGNARLTRTFTVRAGGGPKRGTTAFAES